MPLLNGDSREIIAQNIRTLRKEGRKEAQAIAIAMKHAGSKKNLDAVAHKVAKRGSRERK